jgi:two-component system cell cycle sensor histidine kinase/response regulator CckA
VTPRAGLPQIEALLARLPLGLGMVDRDGRFLFATRPSCARPGMRQATAALSVRPCHSRGQGAFADAVRRHAQGAPTSGDVAVRLRNTPDEPVLISLRRARPWRRCGAAQPQGSSEETRLKHEIAQASKMQAVGQLAGGVATISTTCSPRSSAIAI